MAIQLEQWPNKLGYDFTDSDTGLSGSIADDCVLGTQYVLIEEYDTTTLYRFSRGGEVMGRKVEFDLDPAESVRQAILLFSRREEEADVDEVPA